MKTFLICPVRGKEKEDTQDIVKNLEAEGYSVHWPHRDTDQEDDTGLRICSDNKRAIAEADVIHFVWDGQSQGSLFDLGMAFAMNKKVIPLVLPELTPHKSFQNMVTAWGSK